jgi:ATP-dependent exoDNAse (exonuclease V) beta subunit
LRWNAFLTRFISEPAENASAPTFALPEEMEESAEQVRFSIASVLALHAQLKQSVLAMPASQAIEAIIQATDPTHAGLPDANERAHRLRAVLTLLRVARSKQALLPSPGGLAALLAYIDEMLKLDPALRDLRSSQIDDDAGEEWQQPEAELAASEDVPSSPEGRVQVLTAHASKGLEFGTVIIPRITPPHGYCTTQRRDEDGGLPAGLLAFGEGAPITADELAAREADESRRVFYVAITRAKDRLVLLSQKRKGRSKSSNHYFQELADASASLPVLVASASAGFDAADASGELRETSLAAAGVTPRDAAQRKQSLMQQLRAQLARAIEYVLSGGARGSSVSPEDLFEQARAIASPDPVAAAMALGPKHAAFVRSVQDVLAATSSSRGPAMRVPRGPLQLSYSSIHEYQYCPRCWYVKHVLNMPQPESKVALVGTVTHSALEAFYRAWSEADAEGATLPGLSQLLSFAAKQWQDAHRTAGALQSSLVEADLAHVRALLSNCWEKLHRPTDHVLETELSSNFPLEVDGMTHTMVFKIDRVDQLSDAGFRVIDYKTGRPKKQYLSPEPTDLQLGIYAMGLQHLYPGTDLAACSGEYWLLETAQRGAIRFSDLDIPSIKADIDDAVRSMLSGKFARSKKDCDGLCDILPESIVIGH